MLESILKSGEKMKTCSFLGVAMVLLFSLSSLPIFQAKGNTQTAAVANPLTLFETSEVKVTFHVGSPDELDVHLCGDLLSKVDFQLGETVYMKLKAELYCGSDFPLIADNTIFVVSDDAGTPIWNISMCQLGGGMFECQYFLVHWVPENAGNYSVGILFEETDYPNDFGKVLSFSVFPPAAPTDAAQTELTNPEETVPVIPAVASASFVAIALASAGLPLCFRKRKCTA